MTIPHALQRAHSLLQEELNDAIEQWEERLKFSNAKGVCDGAERFVHELERIPGGEDELTSRAALVLTACRQGSRHRQAMDAAFACYTKHQPTPAGPGLSSRRLAIQRLQPTGDLCYAAQLQEEVIDRIVYANREGIIPLACRELFSEWQTEAARILSEAHHVEADGCRSLCLLYQATQPSATDNETLGAAVILGGFGGGSLDWMQAAAESLVEWATRHGADSEDVGSRSAADRSVGSAGSEGRRAAGLIGALEPILDEGTVQIIAIAGDHTLSVDNRLKKMAQIDPRLIGKNSRELADMLGCDPAAVRQTDYWALRQRATD